MNNKLCIINVLFVSFHLTSPTSVTPPLNRYSFLDVEYVLLIACDIRDSSDDKEEEYRTYPFVSFHSTIPMMDRQMDLSKEYVMY